MAKIPFDDFVKDLELEVVYSGATDNFEFSTSDVNRPGLQLAGYFEHFGETALRLQVIGNIEMYYIKTLNAEVCNIRLEKYMSYPVQCIIITRNLDVPDSFLKIAQKNQRPILRSRYDTTYFIHKAISYLDSKLAPSITMHGELVDVYGIGIILTGESGIGKSEIALELISKGHHLVADDVVDVRKVAENRLVGEAPEITKYLIEVRGIGIIDIRTMYGVGSVVSNKPIDLAIHLETWNNEKSYSRLGTDEEYIDILGVKVPKITIPVRPGRNIAIIIEVAARNFRLKSIGQDRTPQLDRLIYGSDL